MEGLSYYKQALAYFRKRGDTTNYKIILKKLRLARVRLKAIGVAVYSDVHKCCAIFSCQFRVIYAHN